LLPHGIAWLLAAWWALLSTNYNVMYEVHLFSVLPILVALGLLADDPGPWRRAGGVAVLVVTAALVRNQMILGAPWLILVYGLADARAILRAKGQRLRIVGRRMLAYAVAGAATFVVLAAFYARGIAQFPELLTVSQPKHTLNVCQVYAFSYQQRHDDWT